MNDPRNPQDPRFAATQFAPDQQPGQPAQQPTANPYAQQNPWQQPSQQQQPAPQQTAYGQPAPYGAPPQGGSGGGGADAYGNPQPGQQPQHYSQPPAYGQPPGGFGYQQQTQQSYGGSPPGAYNYPAVGPGITGEVEIASNLKIMAVLQYVYAGFTALVSVFALIWVVLGGAMMFAGATGGAGDAAGEAGAGAVLIVFAVVMLLVLGLIVGLHIVAARSLASRRRHTFLIVVACLTMLSVPIGTAIGIWMLVVLTKPEVKATFT